MLFSRPGCLKVSGMGGSWRDAGDEEEDGAELSLAALPDVGDEGGAAASSGTDGSAAMGKRVSTVTARLQNKNRCVFKGLNWGKKACRARPEGDGRTTVNT